MNDELRQMAIEKLRRGEELPQEWAQELFPPEKREYELVYHGKEREEDIIADTMAVPLQPVRTFGKDGGKWHNMLILGDNLQVMKTLLEWKKEGRLCNADGTPGVRLIYIDPPFATKQEFQGSRDQKAYQDKIAGARFIEFLRKRLIFCRELLSADASIVVHLDDRKVHYIKVIMDELFCEFNFRNTVVWRRSNSHNKLNKQFGPIHDSLLFYARGSFPFSPGMRPFMRRYIEDRFVYSDDRGVYQTNYLTGPGIRNGDSGKPWRGFNPTASKRHWAISRQLRELCSRNLQGLSIQQQLEAFLADELIVFPKKQGGQPMYKQYIGRGVLYQDLWCYQPNTQGVLHESDECIDQDVKYIEDEPEKVGYPTQKPEGLVGRFVVSLTNKDDIVFDAFAGSGTTLAVAEKLGRRWIGVDCGKLSIYTIQKRMLNLKKEVGNKGKPLRPKSFTLYNAGLYDFSKLRQLPWADWRFFALQLFGCKDEPHVIGGLNLVLHHL